MSTYLIKSFFLFVLTLSLGCAPLEKISEKILPRDNYFRIYDLNFSDFHPKLNSFLQGYARKNKGSSFQIRRLGREEVIWRGIFKIRNSPESFLVEISSKDAGQKKSKLEIKFIGDKSPRTSASWERASADFFQAVEEDLKITPQSN
jgi:hypothetical protein